MSDLVPVKRALISVSDKTGLVEFARALHEEFAIELVSTGGTARFLREQGLPVKDVSELTGFPEMMDGRIKTLHPKIHGGILSIRDNSQHQSAMEKHGILPIDLVCINLYPFEQTINRPNVTLEEAIENIDIGGPAMVRSAAKNHRFVLVVTSPERYEKVLGDLREHKGCSCGKHRLKQAQRAFEHTAEYDAKISGYLLSVIERPKGHDAGGPARFANVPHEGAIATAAPAEEPAPGSGRSQFVERLLRSASNLQAFLKDLLTTQAVVVAGTEAAAFLVERQGEQFTLRLMQHIRPDESDQATRENAIRAFENIIQPCVAQRKDGVIEVGTPDGGDPQFCLITVLRDGSDVAAVTAVITRCRDMERGKQRLQSMQLVAGYFDLYTMRNPSALAKSPEKGTALGDEMKLSLTKKQDLRYGENPHQKAALYTGRQPAEASVAFAKQYHGKELSYINLLDADAALSCVKEFSQPAACIVKHATPCGAAIANDLPKAFAKAFAGDPLAAFGGIVALNQTVDEATANAITSIDKLLEVIVAPAYTVEALDLLRSRWKNVRLLEVGPIGEADRSDLHMHKIAGGYLVQERDLLGVDEGTWKVASVRQPSEKEWEDLKFAWLVCKHVKSNAIVVAKDGMLLGAGAGQMDRPSAARLAIGKAGSRIRGAVAASDAFFPFPDAPQLLLEAGVTAIIHPGGSVKDNETTELVNKMNAALVLTGQRHFKH